MEEKLFMFTINEENGAQQYLQDIYLTAPSQEEADAYAVEYAAMFYYGAERVNENTWHAEDELGHDLTWSLGIPCKEPTIIVTNTHGRHVIKNIEMVD